MVWVRFFFYFPFVAWLARWIMMTFVVWLGRCSQFIPPGSVGTSEKCLAGSLRRKLSNFWNISGLKKNADACFFLGCYVSNINWFVAERLIDLTFWRPRYDAQLPDDSSMFLIGLYAYIYIHIHRCCMLISYWIPKTVHRKYREFNENNENWEATPRELLWRYQSEIVPSC